MNRESNPERLQAELRKLLEESKPDYGRMLAISSELAALDTNNVRFTADAGLISRLGKELVARQETAVSELVKNAYDADARRVRVTFVNARQPGGTLLIEDNGVGMSREELINGFMRLASTEKIHEPLSPRFRRQRAGRKGIGRFSAQRLGRKLDLITQSENSRGALHLTIDWDDFEKEGDLLLVPNRVRQVRKVRREGTTLRIRGLRDGWTDAEITRIYRYVAELIQPFPLSKRVRIGKKKEKDPGFKATFFRRIRGKEIEIASEDRLVFDYALAEVSGTVDSDGRGEWAVKCSRYAVNEKHSIGPDTSSKSRFAHLTNIHFRAYYFIWEAELVPGQQLTRLRTLASEQGGIRLYRNGFRVLPYGEQQDDWLSLNELYRRRTVLYPIANNNWFGFVQITDPIGEKFEETSSREGLAHSPSFKELTQFIHTALVAAAARVNSERNIKLRASEKDFQSKRLRGMSDLWEKTIINLEHTAKRLESEGAGQQSIGAVRHAAEGLKKAGQVLLEENAMLRVLSSLGLTIGIFTHEIRHQLFHLKSLIKEWMEGSGSKKAFKAVLPVLDSRISLLQAYTSYFDSAISANVRRELRPQDLSVTLYEFIDQFRQMVDREGSGFLDDEIEEDLVTTAMHTSEWASILGNLLTNALKAIRRSKNRGQGKISIRAWRDSKKIIVNFIDNGDGIPNKLKDKIFDPFYTTTNSTSFSKDDLTGTGLGLKIVKDIVSSYNGDIYVSKAPPGYSTCMRIEIPSL
jgi:signal transduction histidine kinase